MIQTLKPWAITTAVVSSMALIGCVDDAYDLENINTDIRVNVNDLVIPINLDEITLDDVFDLDENSVVKEVNGEYAVLVDGRFTSAPVVINPVTIALQSLSSFETTIYEYTGSDVNLPVGPQAVSYEITEALTSFAFSSNDVDNSIRNITKIKGDWNIDVNLKLSDSNHLFQNLEFQKLVLSLPAGLHVSNYPSSNGAVTIGDFNLDLQNGSSVTLKIDEIDVALFENGTFTFTAGKQTAGTKGTVSFNGKVGVKSGFVVGQTASTTTSKPQSVKLFVTPKMGTINVTSVSGNIAFHLNNFHVNDVELTDLPELLYDKDTNIELANPQIYIKLNNPVANDKLKAASGLTLTSYKDGAKVNECSLDQGNEIVVDWQKGLNYLYQFCLSPDKPAQYYPEYSEATHVGYSSIRQLLSGNGLPDHITIDFNNARIIDDGIVNDFVVNRSIPEVEGFYTFLAPLQLGVGSTVVYSESESGWLDETLEKLTITTVSITADVNNSLPFDIELSGYLLDENENHIAKIDSKVDIKAGQNSHIELKTTGTIRNLDGIEYTAKGIVEKANETLKPTQPIKLTNIRVTVGGYYIDTL